LTAPAYHLADGIAADFWFWLWDIRRLLQDHTESITHALQQLRNVRYEGKPVSIHGGMVEVPLIVTEPEPVQYFDDATRAQVTGGAVALVAGRDRAHGASEVLSADRPTSGAAAASALGAGRCWRCWRAYNPLATRRPLQTSLRHRCLRSQFATSRRYVW
jgi:hypothetical protein